MQTHDTNVFDETYLAPSYNVAPTDLQPVVRLTRDGQRELTVMRWGLVPYWAKDPKIGFSTSRTGEAACGPKCGSTSGKSL
jgi:putative SOS response-associated peptidase YedK